MPDHLRVLGEKFDTVTYRCYLLQQIFNNIINRDIPWPKVPEEMSYEAYDLIDK